MGRCLNGFESTELDSNMRAIAEASVGGTCCGSMCPASGIRMMEAN